MSHPPHSPDPHGPLGYPEQPNPYDRPYPGVSGIQPAGYYPTDPQWPAQGAGVAPNPHYAAHRGQDDRYQDRQSPPGMPLPIARHPRRRAALMSVGGVALAVAVLAITGFGWPGWLHTRGGFPVAGATRSSSTSPPENLHTAAGAAAAVAERLTAGKRASITSITCSKARSKVERVLDTFDPRFADDPENQLGAIHVTYQLRGTASRTGDQATARLIERFDNLPKKYDKPPYTTGFAGAMALHKAGDTWQLCGLRFSDSSKAPGPTH